MRAPAHPTSHALRGFTLIEVLVAIWVLSVMALISWRGIDALLRAKEATEQHAQLSHTVQTVLAQWRADLDQIDASAQPKPIDWNGRVLRLVRRARSVEPHQEASLVVVAWTRRDQAGSPTWLRWQSAPLQRQSDIADAWELADSWSQNPSDASRRMEVALMPLSEWQVFFHRGGAWTNPLSSAITTGAASGMPDAVRVQLRVPTPSPFAGDISLDWLAPHV